MIWWGVTGSWRLTSPQVEGDVRQAVRKVILAGDGIVTGGALNVDYFATDAALLNCPDGSQVKVIIPTPLIAYAEHYYRRAAEGVITSDQAKALITQLEHVQRLGRLFEMNFTACNEETYYARNTEVVAQSNALLSFQVNGSKGVQDTIDKAARAGMRVISKSYDLNSGPGS